MHLALIYSAAEIVTTGTNGCYSTAKRSPAPNKRRAAPFATLASGGSGSSGGRNAPRPGLQRLQDLAALIVVIVLCDEALMRESLTPG